MTWTPARIKKLRERHGLTQAQAAELVGVTSAHWSRLESGERAANGSVSILLNLLKDGRLGLANSVNDR